MKLLAAFVICCFLTTAFAQPTSAPATETLLKGDVVFTPPDGWKVDGKAHDDKLAKLSLEENKAIMAISAIPQPQPLPDSTGPKMGMALAKSVRDHAKAGDFELTMEPKLEKDDRFFLKLHHKFQKGTLSGDEIQICRVMGLNLITVAVTSFYDSPEQSKKVFDDAEKMLLSVRSAKQAAAAAANKPKTHPATRPTALPAAKIAIAGPYGWTAETNDNASGVVATYKDPDEPFNTILVSVKPLPPEAKKDPKIRDALVDEIVNGQKTEIKFEGAQPVGDVEKISDRRFLRKVRIRYEKSDTKIQVTSRIIRIGDAVVSVAMASLEQSAADNDRLADEVALKIVPAR
jgi:hypothetical protein